MREIVDKVDNLLNSRDEFCQPGEIIPEIQPRTIYGRTINSQLLQQSQSQQTQESQLSQQSQQSQQLQQNVTEDDREMVSVTARVREGSESVRDVSKTNVSQTRAITRAMSRKEKKRAEEERSTEGVTTRARAAARRNVVHFN